LRPIRPPLLHGLELARRSPPPSALWLRQLLPLLRQSLLRAARATGSLLSALTLLPSRHRIADDTRDEGEDDDEDEQVLDVHSALLLPVVAAGDGPAHLRVRDDVAVAGVIHDAEVAAAERLRHGHGD